MENEIISFDILKINRGKEKICKCSTPQYEIDTKNRLVMCFGCGAVVDPFEALISLAYRFEQLEESQRRMLHQTDTYKKLADEEFSRMIKNKVFRDMNKNYQQGLFPVCPECQNAFNPIRIGQWVNQKYVIEKGYEANEN